MKRKVWRISFGIMTFSTGLLCYLTKQPFIFSPVEYTIPAFLQLVFLSGIFCFLFAFITLPVLGFIKGNEGSRRQDEAFFLLGSLVILQLTTIIMGYTESSFTRGIRSDFFYYYRGAGNSWIYIITGNITVGIAASLYARYRYERKQVQHLSQMKPGENDGPDDE